MKKYSVSHILSSDMWGIYCDGLVGDAETRQDAEHWRDILQAEHDEQAEEIATLKAALQAQSETIAMYKQFAHIVLAYAEDGNLYHLQVIARGVLGDSAVAATTKDESESGE